jgi:hypothetical protein
MPAQVQVHLKCRCVHEQIICSGSESDFFVGSSLIDMYAKCGRMEHVQKVFIKMPTCNVVCWNALLRGFSMHGLVRKCLDIELM